MKKEYQVKRQVAERKRVLKAKKEISKLNSEWTGLTLSEKKQVLDIYYNLNKD